MDSRSQILAAAALRPERGFPVPTERKALEVPESAWTIWKRRHSHVYAGNRNEFFVFQPVA